MHEAQRDVHLHAAAATAVGERRIEAVVDDLTGALRREHLHGVVATRQARSDVILEMDCGPRSRADDQRLRTAVGGVGRGPRPAEDCSRLEASAGEECCGDDRDEQRRCDEAVPDRTRRERLGTRRRPRQPRDERVALSRDGHALDDRGEASVARALVAGREEMLSELHGKAVVHHAICSRMRAGSRSSASMAARSALVARLSRDLVVPSGIPIACAASASGRSR